VTAACESRKYRGKYCAGLLTENYSIKTYVDFSETALVKFDELAWCGGAFLLVKREVLENMDYPWFRHIYVDMGYRANQTGEDIGFCVNAQNSGYKIAIDCGCVVKHLI
jgi:GT2 family glycosyltransferase